MGCIVVKIDKWIIKTFSEYDGYRKPNTIPGTWTGAMVYSRIGDQPYSYVYFEDNMDFISTESITWADIKNEVDRVTSMGWQRMTREDINWTAGV